MGCTSSAPNMPEIAANTNETTENDTSNVKEDDDAKIENDLKDTTVSKVLPICDSLEENIQLDRNSNSFTKIDNEVQEQDNQLINVVENEEIESENKREDNKLLTLKEVADHVILNTILDDIDQTQQTSILHQETNNNTEENVVTDTEEKSKEIMEEYSDEQLLEDREVQENVEESSSPSQSDGNRSTRWEALADIAAELPPSLAVDPITGQIYSLTK